MRRSFVYISSRTSNTKVIKGWLTRPTRKNMQADHIIKFHTDHPMSAPKLVGIRFIGGLTPESPITQENILKGIKNIRNFVGQMPKIIKAKKSVAGFKLRKGADLQVLVTLRQSKQFYPLLFTLIYTSTSFNNKIEHSPQHNHFNFGLTNVPELNKTGVKVDFFLKGGNADFSRNTFFLSKLLIPGQV